MEEKGEKMAVPQLLKWIGNKTRYAEEIVNLMPEQINTYYEPFLGSGAVMAELATRKHTTVGPHYKNAIGSDVMTPLIQIFNYVSKDPKILSDYYEEVINEFNEDRENVYIKVRDRFNETKNPLDFLILSRTCYSGIIRFRKTDGYMSTPIGPHKPIPPKEFTRRVNIWNALLNDAIFINEDYKKVIALAGEGDLVYCDPPYTHSQGIIYGAQGFDIEELFKSIEEAKKRGAKVMLSINGKKKSKKQDISAPIPEGLFERYKYINCGISMINRLQNSGKIMEDEEVHDLLLFTW